MAEAERPIEEGFLRRFRFGRDRDAPAQPASVDEIFSAFVRVEEARLGAIEPWLRARYGPSSPTVPSSTSGAARGTPTSSRGGPPS